MISKNEWDPLKKVIVGSATDAKIPLSYGSRIVNFANLSNKEFLSLKFGNYPARVIDEANEDLEILCDFLKSIDVKVCRPVDNNPNFYNFCPRDTVLVTDDLVIPTPTALEVRNKEYKAFNHHLPQSKVYTIPNFDQWENAYNEDAVGNPEIRALTNMHPYFDAANILRANDDLYYLISNTANFTGYVLLKTLLPNKKIHVLKDIYSYVHLDSTIAFLREGLMLLNPARIKDVKTQLPKSLHNWDIIWAPEPVDIGHYPGYNMASKWINVNLFSVNPNLVILEEHQTNLQRMLEKHKIESAMLPMRHARTMGGCFHCVTLDLERDSQ
jgi:N-dimethylarginine dimethylaminohydrolase